MEQRFLAQFDQFGLGKGRRVSWFVVMLEEHFLFAKCGRLFCNSASNTPHNSALCSPVSFLPFSVYLMLITPCGSHKWWSSLFCPIGNSSNSLEPVCRVKSTVSTYPWCLVCTSGSVFLLWWQNNAETHYDCAESASKTTLKWSHRWASCLKWAIAALMAPAAFSCPKSHVGYDPCGLLKCLQSHLSRTASISGLPIRYLGLLSCYPPW